MCSLASWMRVPSQEKGDETAEGNVADAVFTIYSSANGDRLMLDGVGLRHIGSSWPALIILTSV